MSRSLLLVLAVAACGDRDVTSLAPAKPPDAAPPPGPVLVAPHGGQIAALAIADDASAAISIDDTDGYRFWPSLDGKHEPVVVSARPAGELAIAHHHDGYLVALRDSAAGIELVQLARDGATLARRLLPAEPGYGELAATTNALVAIRADQTIVRLDTPALLVPEHGDQVLAIAARRGKAYAGIASREQPAEIRAVREIAFAGGLSWGKTIELPVPLLAPIALSPSGQRVAGISARTGAALVIALTGTPRVIGTDIIPSDPQAHVLGFLDDERVVFRGGVVVVAPADITTADPWSGTRSTLRVRLGRSAVVTDGLVVGGHATHLILATPDGAKFLGYRDVGAGHLRVTGDQLVLAYGNRVLWLDDELRELRASDVGNDAAGGIAVDDHHLLKAAYTYTQDASRLEVSLVDVTANKEVPLLGWAQGSNVAYDPSTHVIAISGYSSTTARSRLDVATATAKPLRPLASRGAHAVHVFDPAVAGGVVAATTTTVGDKARVAVFVDDKRGSGPISPASTIDVADPLAGIGFDRTATFYSLGRTVRAGKRVLAVVRDGKVVKRLAVDEALGAGAVDPTGRRIALYSGSLLVVIDGDGAALWQRPVWSISSAAFTRDGRLVLGTHGGVLALDAATGERRAAGCGWGFGLSSTEPPLAVFLAPVVCGEAP